MIVTTLGWMVVAGNALGSRPLVFPDRSEPPIGRDYSDGIRADSDTAAAHLSGHDPDFRWPKQDVVYLDGHSEPGRMARVVVERIIGQGGAARTLSLEPAAVIVASVPAGRYQDWQDLHTYRQQFPSHGDDHSLQIREWLTMPGSPSIADVPAGADAGYEPLKVVVMRGSPTGRDARTMLLLFTASTVMPAALCLVGWLRPLMGRVQLLLASGVVDFIISATFFNGVVLLVHATAIGSQLHGGHAVEWEAVNHSAVVVASIVTAVPFVLNTFSGAVRTSVLRQIIGVQAVSSAIGLNIVITLADLAPVSRFL